MMLQHLIVRSKKSNIQSDLDGYELATLQTEVG